MKRYLLSLLLVGFAFGVIPYVTVPIRVNDQSPPQVVSIDINNDSLKYRIDHVIDTTNKTRDTVNYYLNSAGGSTGTGKLVKQTSPTLTGTANVANMVFSGTLTTSALTASLPVFTNASKELVSNAITGFNNVVMSTSPSITTPQLTNPISSGGVFTAPAINGASIINISGKITTSDTVQAAKGYITGPFKVDSTGTFRNIYVTHSGSTTAPFIDVAMSANSFFGQGLRITSTNADFSAPVLEITKSAGTINAVNGSYIKVNNGSADIFRIKSTGVADIDSVRVLRGLTTVGKIGVSTSGPDSTLTVSGSGRTTGNFRVGGYLNTVSKAGIGTASPDSTLTVSGSARVSGNSLLSGMVTAGSNIRSSGDIEAAGGFVIASSSSNRGTYLGMYKEANGLPGFASDFYPTLKTDYDQLFFSANNKYVSSIYNSGTYNEISFPNNGNTNTDVSFKTDAQNSYLRTGKFGIGNNAPDSTLTVTGSGNFSGNLEVGGKIELGGNEAFDYDEGSFTATGSAGWTTTPTATYYYTRVGKIVTIRCEPITGTSNLDSIMISGLPASIRPSSSTRTTWGGFVTDNSNPNLYRLGTCFIRTDGTMIVEKFGDIVSATGTGWTDTGTKAWPNSNNISITYTIQ